MHDVLIIGAGPAGLSAALWCDDLGLDALLLEERAEVGGQLLWVHSPVGNYLGRHAADGRELRDAFAAQVEGAEFDLWTGVEIERVDLGAKRVSLRSGEELQSIFLVIATGLRRRRLGVPGEAEFAGRGMIESAARDRALFAGRDVCVVGGGDAAVEIKRRGALKPFQLAVGGVLVRVGYEPNTDLFREQLATDGAGYVVVNAEQETSVENVFAVGDVANPLAPTISGAAGAGATAAKIIAARLNEATG